MSPRVTLITGLVLIAGTVGAAWSSTQLTNGLIEIPGHWRSTLAALPLVVGVIVVVVGLAKRPGGSRRARSRCSR